MATLRDAPNPLRPYYMPPSIGPPPDVPQSPSARSSKPSLGSQARDMLSDLDYDSYFADTSPTVAGHAKRLLDQALWNYTSVLLAQPFEAAKTILQIHQATGQLGGIAPRPPADVWAGRGSSRSRSGRSGRSGRSRPASFHSGKYGDYPDDDDYPDDAADDAHAYHNPHATDDSDDDAPTYFTSTAPRHAPPTLSPAPPRTPTSRTQSSHSHSRPRSRSRSLTPTRTPPPAARRLDLKRPDSLLEALAQLWQLESAWGVWKATNATFVYNFLLSTTEGWFRSALSALLNVPDPGLVSPAAGLAALDIIDSPSPLMSLGVAVAATAIAAAMLAPLDLVRTRLIVTPISSQPRSIYPCLALLPSWSVAPRLLPATLLHACMPTLLSSSTPLVLRSTLSIDPILTPTTYSFATFLSSTAELFLRLPLETVLRRGQVAVLQDYEDERANTAHRAPIRQKSSAHNADQGSFKTIVAPGPYRGVLGSMWFIAREEGISVSTPDAAKAASAKAMGFERPSRMRKGQGIHGLWRGWRVGVWGLVGIWGAAAMGGGGGGEF